MAYSSDIIEFAKAAYIEQNNEGKQINSLRDISKLLLKKFNVKVSYVTIKNWANKGNWDNKQSILKYIKEKESTSQKLKNQIEKIENNFVNDILQDYANAKYLSALGYDVLIEYAEGRGDECHFTKKEAMTAVKLAQDIKDRLRGLPELQDGGEERKKKTVWKFGKNVIEF